MGKKTLSQLQAKISNGSSTSTDKKQLSRTLMKVLRPKVYITDSCNFRSLVQHLTGNGTRATVSQLTLPSSSSSSPQIVENIDDHGYGHGILESSMESSFGASVESFEVCNQLALSSEEINQDCDDINPIRFDQTVSENLFMNIQQKDSLENIGNFHDSLLQLDDDNDSIFNLYSHVEQEELSIYDYELSGLLV